MFNSFKENFADITDYLPLLLIRIGLSIIFIWFGIDKFLNADLWGTFIPNSIIVLLPFSKVVFIYILGVIELILGLFLLGGFYLRITALITAVHLIGVILSIGFNDLAVRDFGLLIMAVSLVIYNKHLYRIR